ncbi:hypothetical protein PDL71_02580 [Lacibacter sp. MH-610]|uniref:hypothetical protein n=1 Tax=Lacibacter sp. MH-610 TaxID=3020883 RepID=UPI0038913E2C
MTIIKTGKQDTSLTVNRLLYSGFLLLCLYFLVKGDITDAASNLGLALIFDPFAPATWQERKKWQKAWLFVHVTLVFGLFIAGFLWK